MFTRFKTVATLLFSLSLIASETHADKVKLPAGTFIQVRLAQNINGSVNRAGDKVSYQVVEDVLVDGQVAIAKNSFVYGKVSYAKGRGMVGNGGRVSIIATQARSVDGKIVRLERDPLSSEGRTRTEAMMTNVILWGPLGYVSKGRAATIYLDSAFELEVANDVEIETTFVESEPTNTTLNQTKVLLSASIKEERSPIRFNNGKIGKDFVMTFSLPDYFNAPSLAPEDINIHSILEYELATPVGAKQVEWDDRKKRYEVTFGFWDIVQYSAPKETVLEFEVKLPNNSIGIGKTSFERKWKTR